MDRNVAIQLLESQHSFPSDHRFHIIIRSDPLHIEHITVSLAEFCALPHLEGRLLQIPSRNGTYLSLRVDLPCPSAAMVLDIYAHLSTLPYVIKYL